MIRTIAKRVARIEAQRPASRALGHVLRLLPGEARADALRRVRTPTVGMPASHGWLVVPAMVTDATREQWERDFYGQQQALAADADIELSALRRTAQEAGANEVNPLVAALARQHAADESNPWRTQR